MELFEKVNQIEMPDLFNCNTTVCEKEYDEFMSKVKYDDSNIIARKHGALCECEHGEAFHTKKHDIPKDKCHSCWKCWHGGVCPQTLLKKYTFGCTKCNCEKYRRNE